MLTYSTCQACGDALIVTTDDQRTHPDCPPTPGREAELLAKQWLSIATQGVDDELTAHQRMNMEALETRIAELDAAPAKLRDAALWYASIGWPVFPLRRIGGRCDGDKKCQRLGVCQCPKKPAIKNGLNGATTDTARIASWWDRYPDSNIGLATGHAFDVIDVDAPAGYASLRAMEAAGLPWDVHGKAVTASAGLHLLIAPTGEGNTAGIMPGIDYRGKGGYIVAPPSNLGVPGRAWSWVVSPSPRIKRRAMV
ncbi:bifunctional DNA primase/polymerase [Mycolicibacterium fortuitum]|nr:bifunctional DNA primase/polymerase [Mycolicibacterium fortuitum]